MHQVMDDGADGVMVGLDAGVVDETALWIQDRNWSSMMHIII